MINYANPEQPHDTNKIILMREDNKTLSTKSLNLCDFLSFVEQNRRYFI